MLCDTMIYHTICKLVMGYKKSRKYMKNVNKYLRQKTKQNRTSPLLYDSSITNKKVERNTSRLVSQSKAEKGGRWIVVVDVLLPLSLRREINKLQRRSSSRKRRESARKATSRRKTSVACFM